MNANMALEFFMPGSLLFFIAFEFAATLLYFWGIASSGVSSATKDFASELKLFIMIPWHPKKCNFTIPDSVCHKLSSFSFHSLYQPFK
jgi:hypothetical protein